MSAIVMNTELFRPHLPTAAESPLLQSCLGFGEQLSLQEQALAAIPWDPESCRIERLKMSKPRAAAVQADTWLGETLTAARQNPLDEAVVGRFASALSTWAGIQRTIIHHDDYHWKVILYCQRKLPHDHRQTAITSDT